MAHLISIICVVNDAQEETLAIPLSSINNQMGFEFDQLEVVLIDNGRYRLSDPGQFKLFSNLNIRYVDAEEVLAWEAAFNRGIDLSDGQYLLFMGPDGMLNQTSVLQSLTTAITAHPKAELLSGLVLAQDITRKRETVYKVGQDLTTMRGTCVKRDLLARTKQRWAVMPPYSDELFSRVLTQLAGERATVDEIFYSRFTHRNVSPEVMAPATPDLSPDWLRMIGAYLHQLQAYDQDVYDNAVARVFIRFYTQMAGIPTSRRQALLDELQQLLAQHRAAWPQVLRVIDQVKQRDKSPRAPWNKWPKQFAGYVQTFDGYLTQGGVAVSQDKH
ncbi:glycosyltransferase family 2 protein [Lacticaseibacillus absianus]|uniref:glycosyltransferase family 2 protein n=1 Tax=Lacticaseibacillus absianus TaxID=2729623 RepID=UPI0015C80111|nr:glycosyltransferase [Lacticaseibacillus absianus]